MFENTLADYKQAYLGGSQSTVTCDFTSGVLFSVHQHDDKKYDYEYDVNFSVYYN